jgi:hypothetical protein
MNFLVGNKLRYFDFVTSISKIIRLHVNILSHLLHVSRKAGPVGVKIRLLLGTIASLCD